jgi:hypothetical protein
MVLDQLPLLWFAYSIAGWLCAEPVLGQQITGFTLVHAASDTDLAPIANGGIIDLADSGSELSMRANVFDNDNDTPTIGSIVFTVNGTETATENYAPYALAGNSGSDYFPVPALAIVGNHTITANMYSDGSGSGTILDESTITVQVIDGTSTAVGPTLPPVTAPTSFPLLTDVLAYPSSPQGSVSGELCKWHKITVGFQGPMTSETLDNNPFTNYRLDVTFQHHGFSSNSTTVAVVVPGYYAADGNAANSGADSGNVWLVHFAPNHVGMWTWTANFTQGTNVAQTLLLDDDSSSSTTTNGGDTTLSAGYFDGASGSFNVTPTEKTGRDHRGKGRLQYVGKHHLRFAETGEYFLKAGADS